MKTRSVGWGATIWMIGIVGTLTAVIAWGENQVLTTVEATAFTVPYRLLELATDTGGVVGKVHVEEGEAVKPGQILVELKAEVLKAEWAVSLSRVESARAQVAAGDATQKTREVDFNRVKALFDKKIASFEDFDKAKLELDLARLSGDNARAQLTMYEHAAKRDEEAVNRTVIRAPLAGEILRINKREGEAVNEHAPLLSMASVDPLYVICNLPIATTGRVRLGMKCHLTLETRPGDKPLECAVIVVDNVADAASGTYRVKCSLPNPEKTIAAGSKGVVRFATAP